MDEDRISLATLADGAAIEMFDEALEDAWKDIADTNMPAKTPRKITLTLTLSPNEERDFVGVDIGIEKKLAKVRPHETRIELARGQGGKVIAIEIRSRQTELPIPDAKVTNIKRGE